MMRRSLLSLVASLAVVTLGGCGGGGGGDSTTPPPANRAPLAPAATLSVVAGQQNSVVLSPSDPDGDTLAITLSGTLSHGTAQLTGKTLVVQHSDSFLGNETLGYTVTDPDGLSANGTITVSYTNTIPGLDLDSGTQDQEKIRIGSSEALSWTLVAVDPDDGQSLSFALKTPASHGTATVSATGEVSYSAPDHAGASSDSFVVSVSDGYQSSEMTLSVTFIDGNVVILSPQQAQVVAGHSADLSLVVENPDNDSVSLSIVSQPANGTATLMGSTLTYLHTNTTLGNDTCVIKATDSQGSDQAVMTFGVINHIPVAENISRGVRQGASSTLTLAATDSDGHSLSYQIVTQPSLGSLGSLSGNQVVYTAPATAGATSFTYRAFDGYEYGQAATVSMTIGANSAPVITGPTSLTLTAGKTNQAAIIANDADGDTLTYSMVTQGTRGTATISGSTLAYTHSSSAALGLDTIEIRASDGVANSAVFSVPVTISNSTPSAAAVSASLAPGETITLTFQGADADGHSLTYAIVDAPTSGTLGTISGNTVSYTASTSATGTITFTYSASDAWNTSSAATVTLTVEDNFETVTLLDNVRKSESIQAFDLDGDGDLDLVVQDRYAGNIKIIERVGTGWRMHTVAFPFNWDHQQVGVGDFDGDGRLDIAAHQSYAGMQWWKAGNDLSQWSPQAVINPQANDAASVDSPIVIVCKDMNADGNTDMVLASDAGANIYLNNGNGSSWQKIDLLSSAQLSTSVVWMQVADMDNDNDLDVVIADSGNDSVILCRQGSDNSWIPSTLSSTLDGVSSLSLVDIDNDTDLDVVCAVLYEDQVVVLKNPGLSNTTWSESSLVTNINEASDAVLLDVDKDGDLDLFVSDKDQVGIQYFRNSGDLTFGTPNTVLSQGDVSKIICADFDNNPATLEVVACSYDPYNLDVAGIFLATSQDNGVTWSRGVVAPPIKQPSTILSGLYGLNSPDFVVMNAVYPNSLWAGHLVTDAANRLGVIWSEVPSNSRGSNADAVTAIDVDLDGDSDLLWGTALSIQDETGAFTTGTLSSDSNTESVSSTVIYLDNDFDRDVVVASSNSLRFYRNDGTTLTLLRTQTKYSITALAAADLNGDGRQDLLIGTSSGSLEWYSQPEDPSTEWSLGGTIASGIGSITVILPKNIDADDLVEIAVASSSSNTIRLYNKNGTWDGNIISESVGSPKGLAWIDVDDDGTLDLLATQSSKDKATWYNGANNWTEATAVGYLDEPGIISTLDADSDNVYDIIAAGTRDKYPSV